MKMSAGKKWAKRIKDGLGNKQRKYPDKFQLITLKSRIMMFKLAGLDVSVSFRTLGKGGKLTMCNYVYITMVELQLHFSRTNRLLLNIHPLCLK